MFASRACGGRGSVVHERRRAGRIVLREPETACGRTALPGSSCRHFGGKVHNAVEPCGANEPRVRQNRVVLAVVATVKPLRMRQSRQPARCRRLSPGRGRPEGTRLPGEHGISRPTIAQGRPSDRHHLYAAVRFFCVCILRSRPRVRCQHPAFPALSWLERVVQRSKARADCAARTRRCVCDLKWTLESCDAAPCTVIASVATCPPKPSAKAEAIQNRSTATVWIASSQKLLAMTRGRKRAALVPQTQRSVPSTVRCRVGAHVAASYRGPWVPAQPRNACALQLVRDARERITTKSESSARIRPGPSPGSGAGDRAAGCCCRARTKRPAARRSR